MSRWSFASGCHWDCGTVTWRLRALCLAATLQRTISFTASPLPFTEPQQLLYAGTSVASGVVSSAPTPRHSSCRAPGLQWQVVG